MKANESEVFNRVVNRTLYSKKIVMAVMLATIMVGSAFMVAVSTRAVDSTRVIWGWDRDANPPPAAWSTGVTKGYAEGEVVPIMVTLVKPADSNTLSFTIGFEWGKGVDSNPDYRGFDEAVQYNELNDATIDPSAPFNDVYESASPFCTDTSVGTISTQSHHATVPEKYQGQWFDEWDITYQFLPAPVDTVYNIRVGGLLYLTNHEATPENGASFYPGASLQVRIIDQGASTLPIMVEEILTPPNLALEKFCDKESATEKDLLTFTIFADPMGQSDAALISLTDKLDDIAVYQAGSAVYWYSHEGVETDETGLGEPAIVHDLVNEQYVLTWDLTGLVLPGTGPGGQNGVTLFGVKFYAKVVSPLTLDDVGTYTNWAVLTYTDMHGGIPTDTPPATVDFDIYKYGISISKWAVVDPKSENEVDLATAQYVGGCDGLCEEDPTCGDADTYWYAIQVANTGTVPMAYSVTDDILASGTLYDSEPLPGGVLPAGTPEDPYLDEVHYFEYTVTGEEDENPDEFMFLNTAKVIAYDGKGHKADASSGWYVDIVHPDLEVIKTADRTLARIGVPASEDYSGQPPGEVGRPGETIHYTITVTNTGDVALGTDDDKLRVYDPLTSGMVPVWDGILGTEEDITNSAEDLDHPYYQVIDVEYTLPDSLDEIQPLQDWWMPCDGWGLYYDEARKPHLRNLVIVEGGFWTDLGWHCIERCYYVDVLIVDPRIEIVKTVMTDPVGSDLVVKYKIEVTNTGDTPLWFIYDDILLSPDDRDLTQPNDPANAPPPPTLPDTWDDMVGEFETEIGVLPTGTDIDWWGYLDVRLTDTQYWAYTVDPETDLDENGMVNNRVDVLGWHNPLMWNNNWEWDMDQKSVMVSGYIDGNVFHNRNLDLAWDQATEEGLNDWYVQLFVKNDVDVFVPLGDAILTYSIWVDDDGDPDTDPVEVKGYFAFDGLLPSEIYKVREFLPTSGPEANEWFVTYPKDADKTTYPFDEWSDELTVLGGRRTTQNFGNSMYGHIWGCKFIDYDMNGVHDDGEPMYVGWVMWLSPAGDTNQEHWISQPTNALGQYDFKVLPGLYDLWEEDKDGWIHTNYLPPQSPVPGKIFGIDVTEGFNPECGICFGNIPTIDIWGVKFYDKNMDGVQGVDVPGTPDEPGLNGFTIWLTGDTIKVGDPAYSKSVVTVNKGGADGYYEFLDVPPGTYVLSENPAPGWPGQAADWFITNLEIDPTAMDVVIDFSDPLVPDVPDDWQIDIGNMRYAKIDGYKFEDTYDGDDNNLDGYPDNWPNGVYDSFELEIGNMDEYGIGDWRINLAMWDGSEWVPVDHMTTLKGISHPEKRGWYEFTELLPGRYKLWEQDRSANGWTPTTPDIVQFVVPEHPWGSPVVIRVDFGNIMPTADPEVPFVLEAGNNIWSSPVTTNGLTAKGLLAIIGAEATSITTVNPATGGWISYVSGLPDRFDFPIIQGHAYYIYATQKVEFALVGEFLDSSQVPLVAGWNMIGLNQMEPVMASKLMTMVSGCTASTITVFDPESGQWKSYVSGLPSRFDLNVVPGVGYLLYVDGPGVLSCG